MAEFLRILFLSQVVLLTPEPLNAVQDVELRPRDPLVAITPGAGIDIDVSSMIKKSRREEMPSIRRRVEELFPAGSVEAKLVQSNGAARTLRYEGGFSYSNESVRLSLPTAGDVEAGAEFTHVILHSDVPLDSAAVYWRNYRH